MKLQFDANQAYQKDAIESVTDLFDGQQTTSSTGLFSASGLGLFQNEHGVGNLLQIDDATILQNLRTIQKRNGLAEQDEFEGRNFTIEMETGTGKTYVYLRTIFELQKRYGFGKFIIVVPGKAIREGVLKSLEITREHLRSIYGNTPYSFFAYNSKRPSDLRVFATSNTLSVMLVNIEAFDTVNRVINKANDGLGGVPIELVQKTNPIVIMDEPQNMETEIRRTATDSLNPLCTLRYSATHRQPYNQIYRLTPIDAYDKGLVKRIEVASVREGGSNNDTYIKVLKTTPTKNSITAEIEIEALSSQQEIKKKRVKLKVHTTRATPTVDLFKESGGLPAYEGIKFDGNCSIDLGSGEIEFQGLEDPISINKGIGELDDKIRQQQIRDTVEAHLEKMRKFNDRGEDIKVLSLFFIDTVAKYRDHTNNKVGVYAQWFEEIYTELSQLPKYKKLKLPKVDLAHDGYFSKDKAGSFKDTRGTTEADRDTYALIMKDKERLLSSEEPLQFIFSHSTLREGWDNPNVFQICTLNETGAYVKKRQEIGRGLRLPVRQDGSRVVDTSINTLTVIANESYDTFAKTLQGEIEAETGLIFDSSRIKNKRKRRQVHLKKKWGMDERFLELWERIKHKTNYAVNFNEPKFIKLAGEAIGEIVSRAPQIKTDIAKLEFDAKRGILTNVRKVGKGKHFAQSLPVPNIMRYVSNHTKLRPATIAKILETAGEDILIKVRANPQHFMDSMVQEIKHAMQTMIIDGIKYEKIGDEVYDKKIFKDAEIASYIDNVRKVKNKDKTLYDHVVFDSEVENSFAGELEARDEIEFYVKLPANFKIPTPLGTYNPDWAIVFQGDKRIYLVTETKSTNRLTDLSSMEQLKIKAGREHFAAIGEVVYVAPHEDMEGMVDKL